MGHLNLLLKQALETFSSKSKELFQHNLENLKVLMNKATIDDVKLNPALLTESTWRIPNKAPATYVDIYEDDNLTLGVFILKPGKALPLHDHPDMHGLIKILFGKVKITSYSFNTESTSSFETKSTTYLPMDVKPYIVVEKSAEIVADNNSSCCVLYPEYCNLHEIESIDGPAAFMDILSPPYETVNYRGQIRRCNYYKILNELAPNIFKLQKVETPSDFWTDSEPLAKNLFN